MLSREVHGIIRYLANSGVPFKVTDIDTPGVHTPTSYHYAAGTGGNGLAVDFAGPTPSTNSPQLRRIVDQFMRVQDQLAEFLHPWNDAYHDDHVHVAVPLGTVLAREESTVATQPKIVSAFPHEAGYVLVTEDGAIYCFNCVYYGGLRWDGNAWVLR